VFFGRILWALGVMSGEVLRVVSSWRPVRQGMPADLTTKNHYALLDMYLADRGIVTNVAGVESMCLRTWNHGGSGFTVGCEGSGYDEAWAANPRLHARIQEPVAGGGWQDLPANRQPGFDCVAIWQNNYFGMVRRAL
jgi:hypothetical protein